MQLFLCLLVPPRVELGLNMKNLIVVKAGDNIFLDAEVFGKPLPKVSWKRDGAPLVLAEGMKLSQKKHVHLLELYSVTKKESGDYTITAENISGTKYATIKVKVLGTAATHRNNRATFSGLDGGYMYYLMIYVSLQTNQVLLPQ